MSLLRFLLALLSLPCLVACDGGVEVETAGNPVPVLVAVQPAVVAPTAPTTTVQVRGLGFAEGAVASFGGVARATEREGETLLSVTIPFVDLTVAGPALLSVVNPEPGGGESAPIEILVGHVVPQIDSVWADVSPPASGVTLRIRGSGFLSGNASSSARWNGIALPTTVLGADELLGVVGDHLLRDAGTTLVSVHNPAPGGGLSTPVPFARNNPVPTVDSTEPVAVRVQTTTTLSIRGSGFAHGATVLYGAQQLTPTSVSPTRLVVSAPGAAHPTPGEIVVHVVNPAPGGGASSPLALPVWALPPRIDGLNPLNAQAGAPSFTLELRGARFWPEATVEWGGETLATTVIDSTRIAAEVSAARVSAEGLAELTVRNPTPGGDGSAIFWVTPQQAAVVTVASPVWVPVGTAPFTLQILGDHFAAAASVSWNGVPRAATVVSATRIDIELGPSDLSSIASAVIAVANPVASDPAEAAFHVLPPVPSGTVVYERWAGAGIEVSELDGSGVEVLAAEGFVFEPDASPTDRSVAFGLQEAPGEYPHIFIADPAGQLRRLVEDNAAPELVGETSPRFSRDGQWVYFEGLERGFWSAGIWRARVDGTALELVHQDESRTISHPAPSNNGDRVAYQGADDELAVFDMSSGTVTRLGVAARPPRWAPDDSWIAYQTSEGELRIIRPDGSEDRSIAANFGSRFDWSPDGHFIVGTTLQGEAQIVAYPSGVLVDLPPLGHIGSIAWFDNP